MHVRESTIEQELIAKLDEIKHTLRDSNASTRNNCAPSNYTLVNITDWCKRTFEVASLGRVNTDYSHHQYDLLPY